MTRFAYRAVSAQGEVIEGTVEASSSRDAVARLVAQGHVPLTAVPIDAHAEAQARERPRIRAPAGLPAVQRASSARQLATVLGAGVPLDEALALILRTQAEPARSRWARVRERVRGGAALAHALDDEPGVFEPLEVSVIRASEAAGTLPLAFAQVAEHIERAVALRQRISAALLYPMLLTLAAMASLVVLFVVVVPRFDALFADLQTPLPTPAAVVLAAGRWAPAIALVLAGAIAAGVAYGVRRTRTTAGRMELDATVLRLPHVGALVQQLALARVIRTLAVLLASGTPLAPALALARPTAANRCIEAQIETIERAVRDGEPLARALGRLQSWPPEIAPIVNAGEATGALAAVLMPLAGAMERDAEATLQRWLTLLEPILILVLGVIVGGIVLTLISALLSVTEVVG